MRFLPISATSMLLTSLRTCVGIVAITSPVKNLSFRPCNVCHSDRREESAVLLLPTSVDAGSSLLLPCVGRLSQTRVTRQLRRFIGRFPGEIRIVTSEVSISRGLAIDRPPQIERFDDPLGSQLEVRTYQLLDGGI